MNIKIERKTVNIKELSKHSFLEKYSISKLSDFEIQQLNRFDLPVGQVLATTDNKVLFNWEAVEEAKKRGIEAIEISVLTNLDKDMAIQVISIKNIRNRLSRRMQAELIAELSKYLTENSEGKKWRKEIPGKSTNEKIGSLIEYSYGMTYEIQSIYKYCPDLLDQIDQGEQTFTSALAVVQKQKEKLASPKSTIRLPESQPQESKPTADKNDSKKNIGNCESIAKQTVPVIVPTKVICDTLPETSKWRYAGEQHMVECEPISGVTITYASGKTVELVVNGDVATGTIDGTPTKQLEYSGKIFNKDNSEFHVMTVAKDRVMIQLILNNIDNIAA